MNGQLPCVMQTKLNLPLIAKGKVRDIYSAGEDRLLIVTTDRLSAFDVVLPDPIPSKGKVLNQITLFWFEKFSDLIPNHLITADVDKMNLGFSEEEKEILRGRSVLVRKAQPLPVECVVRGYITGSGWKDYQKNGAVCGHKLEQGLQRCQQLPKALFTPSTKADEGHDENISTDEARKLVGDDVASQIEFYSLEIYRRGAEFALERGIVIADTKFEFGLIDGRLILIDEVLTPDSSRFWPKDKYEVGREQDSYDKQIVRNYLETLDWNKDYPGPELPKEIINKTSESYTEIYKLLSGRNLD